MFAKLASTVVLASSMIAGVLSAPTSTSKDLGKPFTDPLPLATSDGYHPH